MTLGFFCLGLNFYISLHLGYEFTVIAISLEVASLLIALALSKTQIKINNNTLILITLSLMMASSYLLFVIDFVSLFDYLIALLCTVIPIVLLGLCIIQNSHAISIRSKIITAITGFTVSMFLAYIILEMEDPRMIFNLSAAAMTLVILLMVNIASPTKIVALCIFFGGTLFINNENSSNQIANWSLAGNPVTKASLNLLYDPDRYYLSIDETSWEKSGRVDVISSRRSRNEDYSWIVHNGSNSVPLVDKAHASISWWDKHYPLMILPFELNKPSKVLTIATAKGPDVDISAQLYGAETTSIYNDCVSLNDSNSCDYSTLNAKLEKEINSHMDYDLISFSITNQVAGPHIGVSASHEAIHTIEVFQKLYDSLNNNGLLVINTREAVMLHKSLSYVWHIMSEGSNHKIINYENNIRVLQLNQRALYKDTYNYLVLVSKQGFTDEQLHALNEYVWTAPISKVIYDSDNNIPPYKYFKQLDKIKVSDAVLHLTRASSWKYKKLINLEPSRISKPNYFHLTAELHPFIATLSAIFLFLAIYGLFFSHSSMRSWRDVHEKNSPMLSVLLFQIFLCTTAFILLIYVIVSFASVSLGYSSSDSSMLIILALAAFAAPYVLTKTTKIISKTVSGIWFYVVILFLSVILLFNVPDDIGVLLGLVTKTVIFILTVIVSFFSGLIHRQVALFTERLYPDVWFWFWYMTSVGVVLGTITAQYIVIKFDFEHVLQTVIGMFLFATFIAWWCIQAIKEKPVLKNDIKKELN